MERAILSKKQIDELTDILYNYNYSEKTKGKIQSSSTCGCSHMRHAILFLDNKENIISHMQIDFIETHIETDLPDESFGVFCSGKYELIKSFFKSIGIKQFDNEVREEQDIEDLRHENLNLLTDDNDSILLNWISYYKTLDPDFSLNKFEKTTTNTIQYVNGNITTFVYQDVISNESDYSQQRLEYLLKK